MKARKIHKNISGIYLILNIKNGKVYVGKSHNIYNRITEHISRLKNNICENEYLQNSFNKYGKESFDYSILEICNDEDIVSKKELFWMKKLNSLDRNFGYNLRSDSDSKMIVHKLTSLKISKRLKKEWSLGIRKDHGKKLSNNWNKTPNRKIEQSKIMSKNLTKYHYFIINKLDISKDLIMNYQDLINMGLKSAMSSFYRKKSNIINIKGYTIKRVNLK